MLSPDEANALFQIAVGVGKIATILGVIVVLIVIRS